MICLFILVLTYELGDLQQFFLKNIFLNFNNHARQIVFASIAIGKLDQFLRF
jgi:hypothetical protein